MEPDTAAEKLKLLHHKLNFDNCFKKFSVSEKPVHPCIKHCF